MGLEDLTGTGKFIDDLVNTNPLDGDQRSEGNKHIFGIKNVLLNSLPNIAGAVASTQTELDLLDGVSSVDARLLALEASGSGPHDIDLNLYNRIHVTPLNTNITFTFSNAAAGDHLTFLLGVVSGSKPITYSGITANGCPALTGSLSWMLFEVMFESATTCNMLARSKNGVPIGL